MGCKGLHCGGCGHGGGVGGILLAVIIAAVVIIGAIGKAVSSAVTEVGHVLEVALEVALYTLAVAGVLGALAVFTLAGLRVRRWRAARLAQAARVRAEVVTPDLTAIIHGSINADLPAIEAPKLRADMYAASEVDHAGRG